MADQDFFCLDKKYSTTRLVTRKEPAVFNKENQNELKSIVSLPSMAGRQGEGGLRTKGYFKENFPSRPIITVVTVVLNDCQNIEETILSVIKQSYDNVEYIVLDGASSDGTIDLIKKYDDFIDYWVSEPDKGIYQAFNKGIDLSSGKWIAFMNCGDIFFDMKTLESIFLDADYKNASIIYGSHEVIYPSGKRKIRYPKKPDQLWKGSVFCHQSSFVLASLQKRYKFDECYKIGADFKFFYTALQNRAGFRYVDFPVSSVTADGLSDRHRIESMLEHWMIVEKSDNVNLFYSLLIIQEIIKSKIKLTLCKLNKINLFN